MVKSPSAMQETWVQFLGWEDPLKEGMTTTPIFLPGDSPWTEVPGRLQSMGLQRVGHYWATELNNPKTVVCMCMCLEQEEMGLTSYYRPRFNLANYIIIKYHILSTNALSTVFKHFKLCSLPRLRHYHWNTFDLMNTRTVKLNMHVNILSNIISLSL